MNEGRPTEERSEDPLVRSSRREAVVAFGLWGVAALYTLVYCGLNGYDATKPLTYVLGFPHWVFWGIVVPWTICTVLSIGFALFFMQDHPLDEPPAEN